MINKKDVVRHGKTIVSSVVKGVNLAKVTGSLNFKNLYLLNIVGNILDTHCCLSFEHKQRLKSLYNHIKYNDKSICNIRIKDLVAYKNVDSCKDCTPDNLALANVGYTIPTVDDNNAMVTADRVFAVGDFTKNFRDPFNGSYQTVIITSLPTNGIIQYNGVDIRPNFSFEIYNISNLKYILTNTIAPIVSNFTFKTSNDSVNKLFTSMATFTLNIEAKINLPPSSVGDNSITIAHAVTKIFTVADFTTNTTPAYVDPEGDAAADLKILSLPTDGELQFNGTPVTTNQIIPFSGTLSIASGLLRYIASSTNTAADVETFNFEISDTGSNTFVG